MEPSVDAGHVLGLHELVTGSADIGGILRAVTGFASEAVGNAVRANVDCALTLRRRKRAATVAGSSNKAVLLDRIEQALGQGPCLKALDVGRPVILEDAATDTIWPRYSRELLARGRHSVLGVPMEAGESAEGVLNSVAPAPGLFTAEAIEVAAGFADVAGSTLRLVVRVEAMQEKTADLKAAMESRTTIDLACGVIMAQNRCSHDEAFNVLRKASSHRNEKLHRVAARIVESLGSSAGTMFYPVD